MFNHNTESLVEALGLTRELAKDFLEDVREISKKAKNNGEFLDEVEKLPTIGLAYAIVVYTNLIVRTKATGSNACFMALVRQFQCLEKNSKIVEWLIKSFDKKALAFLLLGVWEELQC